VTNTPGSFQIDQRSVRPGAGEIQVSVSYLSSDPRGQQALKNWCQFLTHFGVDHLSDLVDD